MCGIHRVRWHTTRSETETRASVVKAGVGKLIAGWDAALLKMSVGEKAVVTIPPEHAYGSKGSSLRAFTATWL